MAPDLAGRLAGPPDGARDAVTAGGRPRNSLVLVAGPGAATAGSGSAALPGKVPPLRHSQGPKCRVADFVERVVKQGERGAKPDDAQARSDDPQRLPGLERHVVLRG